MLGRRNIRELARPGILDRALRLDWTHPEWCVATAAAAAWVLMARMPGPHAGHAGHHPPGGAPGSGALSSMAMVIAMMLPLVIPHVRHIALSGPGPRRHLSVAAFLLGYLAAWIVAQALIVGAFNGIASRTGGMAAAGIAMIAAALWELAPTKERQLRRCDRRVPLEARGWRAGRDCASFGASTGIACVATCWALMAACAAFAHSLPLMAVLFGVQVSGRFHQRRSPGVAAAVIFGACLLSIAAGSR